MFFIQNLAHGMRYCICQDSWQYFKIINLDVEKAHLHIYMQGFGGIKRKFLEVPKSYDPPEYLLTNKFEFTSNENVRIDVLGGRCTLIGISHPGSQQTTIFNNFLLLCPFSNFNESQTFKEDKIEDPKVVTIK